MRQLINTRIYILEQIVNKYKNIEHRAIKMKPVDVKSNTYVNSIKETNDNDTKLDKLDMHKLKHVPTNLSNLVNQITILLIEVT